MNTNALSASDIAKIDELLADLVLDDGNAETSLTRAAKSPKTEIHSSSAKHHASLNSETELPRSCNPAAREIPEICSGPGAIISRMKSPVSERNRTAHHGPDLGRDTQFIRLLAKSDPAAFTRDRCYTRAPFKARVLPVQKGTRTLLSIKTKAHPLAHPTASITSKSESQAPVTTRKKKRPSQVRPPAWTDMTPELQGVWITLTMRRTLPTKYAALGTVEELGPDVPCAAFTLSLSTAYEAQLRRSFNAAEDSLKREHPALTLRKRIERHVKTVVKREVDVCVVTEVSPEGRLHCHGIINLIPSEAVPKTGSGKKRDDNPILAALRRAGGPFNNNAQFQADIEPCATPGWLLYSRKEGNNELEGSSMSQGLQRLAKESWGKFRQNVIVSQKRLHAAERARSSTEAPV